jgi:hypothetical protein
MSDCIIPARGGLHPETWTNGARFVSALWVAPALAAGIVACNEISGADTIVFMGTGGAGGMGGSDASAMPDTEGPPPSGCSDGTRESFKDTAQFPTIAGCGAAWGETSMRAPATGVACGNDLGTCSAPADACATGWHVCGAPPYGPQDISGRISVDGCLGQPGEFAAALGDQTCDPCTPSTPGAGAACCGSACIQQNGSCIYPSQTAWFGVIGGHTNLCGDIIAMDPASRGALCCKDSGP